jgi:thiamine kinase-like enzyme
VRPRRRHRAGAGGCRAGRARPAGDGISAGRLWEAADYGNLDALRRLGERLYALHRLPPPAIEAFDPWRVAQAYVRQIDGAHTAELERPLQRLQALSAELRTGHAAMTVVHGDLWQGNLLQGSRLWLLDWEYAQLSDPLMDVACLLAYYPRPSATASSWRRLRAWIARALAADCRSVYSSTVR